MKGCHDDCEFEHRRRTDVGTEGNETKNKSREIRVEIGAVKKGMTRASHTRLIVQGKNCDVGRIWQGTEMKKVLKEIL